MDTPVPQTVGESLAQVSRARRWTAAVFCQIAVLVGIPFIQIYPLGRSFFTDVAWRLALLLALSAYLSLVFAVKSYAELFLPRTPVAVADNIVDVGIWVVGFCVIMMEAVVFALQVENTRVLAGCTGFVAAFVVSVVVFWVWLARTYGGDEEAAAPIQLPTAAADDIC